MHVTVQLDDILLLRETYSLTIKEVAAASCQREDQVQKAVEGLLQRKLIVRNKEYLYYNGDGYLTH